MTQNPILPEQDMKAWTLLGEYCGVVKTGRQLDEGAHGKERHFQRWLAMLQRDRESKHNLAP
jgi:hypothetical protein